LSHGHIGIHAVCRLDHYRFIGTAAEDQHTSSPRQRPLGLGGGLPLRTVGER
jgi:hypothetical protein